MSNRLSYIELLSEILNIESLWLNSRIVYNLEGEVVGRIELTTIDDHEVNINLIAVYSEFRKQGYFKSMLNAICKTADINAVKLNLIPMPTHNSEIQVSDISWDKLKSIYASYGFEADYPDMKISNYTREP